MQTNESAQARIEEFTGLPDGALVERYTEGINRLDRRLLDLTDAQLDTFFRPEAGVGRWSCRVLVGHLADAEAAFAHRFRRAVAEQNPVLSLWDPDAFVDAGLYAPAIPVAGHVAMIHTTRLWCADWLRTLDAEAWTAKALHPERGEESLHAMLARCTWHLEHHAWYLTRKIELLLSDAARR